MAKEAHMRRYPGMRLTIASLAVMGVFALVNASSAVANHVSCGQTITQDTTLDSDLIGCPDDGVVIGADHITLDLNGHTIAGTDFHTGVDNEGHPGVVIENGTIRSFYDGVGIYETTGNIVRDLTIQEANSAGVALYFGEAHVVEDNVISGLSGIVPYSSD